MAHPAMVIESFDASITASAVLAINLNLQAGKVRYHFFRDAYKQIGFVFLQNREIFTINDWIATKKQYKPENHKVSNTSCCLL